MKPKKDRDDDAVEWARRQSKNLSVDIPDRQPGEEPATQKQKDYIRALVISIEEAQLNGLGKWQASALIDQIKTEKKSFTNELVSEYVSHAPRRSGCAILLFPVFGALFYFALRWL